MRIPIAVKRVGAVLGGLAAIIGLALDFKDIAELVGVSAKGWLLVGAILFIVSVIALVWGREERDTSPEVVEDLVDIGEHKISRNLIPRLFSIGYPRQLASEPSVSWWGIPISLNRLEGSPIRNLDHCLVYLELEGFRETQLRWQSENREGSDEASLRIGEEPRITPVIGRAEQDAVWQGITLFPRGIARITDRNFLLHHRNFTDIQFHPEIRNHRLGVEVRFQDWRWRRRYYVSVPEINSSNGHFTMFPSEISGESEIEVHRI